MGHAIRDAIREQGRSVSNVAKAVGHDPSWLYRIINGRRGITAIDLERLGDELDVQFRHGGELREERSSYVAEPPTAIAVVDQEVSASLRGGVVVDHVYLSGRGRVPQHIVAVKVRGDCLAPHIVDGDYVIVDTSRTAESGNPVVATVDGHLHVKRYRVKPSGATVLTSNEGEIAIQPWQIDGVVIALNRDMLRLGDLL